MIYKRGRFYWYEFETRGRRYKASTEILVGKGVPGEKSELARDVETAKRQKLALEAHILPTSQVTADARA